MITYVYVLVYSTTQTNKTKMFFIQMSNTYLGHRQGQKTLFSAVLLCQCIVTILVVFIAKRSFNFSYLHLLLQNHWVHLKRTCHIAFSGKKDSICTNERPHSFPRGDYNEIVNIHKWNFKNLNYSPEPNFNQAWHKAFFG